ncbi:hypothetical protein EW146_g8549, partial [Bondarzewia mesenterica]
MEDPRSRPPAETRPTLFSSKASQFIRKLSTVRDRFASTRSKDRPSIPYLTTRKDMGGPKPFMSQPMLSLDPRPSAENDDSSSSPTTRGSIDIEQSNSSSHHIPQKRVVYPLQHRKSPSAPLSPTPHISSLPVTRTPPPHIVISEVDVSTGSPKLSLLGEGGSKVGSEGCSRAPEKATSAPSQPNSEQGLSSAEGSLRVRATGAVAPKEAERRTSSSPIRGAKSQQSAYQLSPDVALPRTIDSPSDFAIKDHGNRVTEAGAFAHATDPLHLENILSSPITEEPEEIELSRAPSPPHASTRPRSFTTPASPVSFSNEGVLPPAITPVMSQSLSRRPNMPHLSSLPPSPSRFQIPGAPARFSPAIISRQPPHPILTLPPISPVQLNARPTLPRQRSQSLRSMPALPMEGADEEEQADHDNRSLGDLSEEDEDEMEDDGEERDATDDEAESGMNSPRPVSVTPPHTASRFPDYRNSPLDTSFLDTYLRERTPEASTSKPNASPRQTAAEQTPSAFRPVDYFSFKVPERTPVQTPQLPDHSSPRSPAMPQPRLLPMPSPASPPVRPSLYQQASRSMIDMTAMVKERSPELNPRESWSIARGLGTETPSAQMQTPFATVPPQDSDLGPSLRRQRSMPTFKPSSSPPPYPDFAPPRPNGPPILPRDEEGREPLPKYTNDIYLRAIMPRKMEFIAPGVQARNRKWQRTLCVLEGTSFRVYKCPPGVAGVGVIGEWWEKTVGVGDIAEAPATASVANALKARERELVAQSLAKIDSPVPSSSNGSAPPIEVPPVPVPPPLQEQQQQQQQQQQPPPPPQPTRSRLLGSTFLRSSNSTSHSPTRSRFSSEASRDSAPGRRSFSGLRSGSIGASQSSAAPSSGASNLASTSASTSASASLVPAPASQSRSRSRASRT